MSAVTLVLKDPTSTNPTLIYLIYRRGQQRLKYSTQEKVLPANWNATTQQVKRGKGNSDFSELNIRLTYMRSKIKQLEIRYLNEIGCLPTLERLKNLMDIEFRRAPKTDNVTLMVFFEQYINEAIERINPLTKRTISIQTVKSLHNTLNTLRSYKNTKQRNLDFATIDVDFYQSFVSYMNTEKRFSINTIGKHIRNLKTVLNAATERGYNTNFQYKNRQFKVITSDPEQIYLTENELTELYRLDLSGNKRLEAIRDLFIVGCYTGLRFSDFSRLSSKNIKDGFISIKTQKTAQPVKIPIHQYIQEILLKYKDNLPNAISNQKMNQYLKEVGQQCKSLQVDVEVNKNKGGIEYSLYEPKYKLLTTHTARRSFATNLYKAGQPLWAIMSLTGHKTEGSFFKYIRMYSDEGAKVIQSHWDKKLRVSGIND